MPPQDHLDSDRPAVLLVHGAWHGPWCWEDLIPILSAKGWPVYTVDLPSGLDIGAPQPVPAPGLYDDAEAITATLAEIDRPTVVVAHSYGGAPATEACATATNVIHVIYLAAFQLDTGESVRISMGAPREQAIPSAGYSSPMHGADLYSDVEPATADRALRRLRLQSDPSRAQLIRRAGWRFVPSSYIICDNDGAIPAQRQREFATRADTTYHLRTGHSPFYSAPGLLADLLGEIIDTATEKVLP